MMMNNEIVKLQKAELICNFIGCIMASITLISLVFIALTNCKIFTWVYTISMISALGIYFTSKLVIAHKLNKAINEMEKKESGKKQTVVS